MMPVDNKWPSAALLKVMKKTMTSLRGEHDKQHVYLASKVATGRMRPTDGEFLFEHRVEALADHFIFNAEKVSEIATRIYRLRTICALSLDEAITNPEHAMLFNIVGHSAYFDNVSQHLGVDYRIDADWVGDDTNPCIQWVEIGLGSYDIALTGDAIIAHIKQSHVLNPGIHGSYEIAIAMMTASLFWFNEEQYDVEHRVAFDDTISSLMNYINENGGEDMFIRRVFELVDLTKTIVRRRHSATVSGLSLGYLLDMDVFTEASLAELQGFIKSIGDQHAIKSFFKAIGEGVKKIKQQHSHRRDMLESREVSDMESFLGRIKDVFSTADGIATRLDRDVRQTDTNSLKVKENMLAVKQLDGLVNDRTSVDVLKDLERLLSEQSKATNIAISIVKHANDDEKARGMTKSYSTSGFGKYVVKAGEKYRPHPCFVVKGKPYSEDEKFGHSGGFSVTRGSVVYGKVPVSPNYSKDVYAALSTASRQLAKNAGDFNALHRLLDRADFRLMCTQIGLSEFMALSAILKASTAIIRKHLSIIS